MSRLFMTNEEGETLAVGLDIPLYEGSESELHKQALISLVSAQRHLAAAEAMDDNGLIDMENEEEEEAFGNELQMGIDQLISTIISLVTIVDRHGIDINQEIWETPFRV